MHNPDLLTHSFLEKVTKTFGHRLKHQYLGKPALTDFFKCQKYVRFSYTPE